MTPRRDLITSLCDSLWRQGTWPTLGAIKKSGLDYRGSDGDVQNDIDAWRESVRNEYFSTIPDIPPAASDAMRDFWKLVHHGAMEIATATFKTDRDAMQVDVQAAMKCASDADQQRDEALARVKETEQQLSVVNASVKHFEQNVSDLKASVIAKDERIQALNDELARTAATYERNLAEVEGARVFAMNQIEASRSEARAANARIDGVLAEAEEFKARARAELDAYRTKANAAEDRASKLRDRVEAMTDTESTLQLRILTLEASLKEAEREKELLRERASHVQTASKQRIRAAMIKQRHRK